MRLVIEEGLRPDGCDFIHYEGSAVATGEANGNPLHRAKERGDQIIQVAALGDGFAIMGLSLEPVMQDGKLTAFVVANCCKPSQIVGIEKVVKVAIGKVGEIDLNGLKARIAEGLGEKWEPPAPEPAQ